MLDTVWEIWRTVIVNTVIVDASIYAAAGLAAALIHSGKSWKWLFAPIAAALFGGLAALVLAAVPTVLLAWTYVSVPSKMSRVSATIWGSAQGILIAVLHSGVLRRIL